MSLGQNVTQELWAKCHPFGFRACRLRAKHHPGQNVSGQNVSGQNVIQVIVIDVMGVLDAVYNDSYKGYRGVWNYQGS